MRAWVRAAAATGMVLTGLAVVPGANARAATEPTYVHQSAAPAAVGPTAPAPVIAAYPPGVSQTQFLKALEQDTNWNLIKRQPDPVGRRVWKDCAP